MSETSTNVIDWKLELRQRIEFAKRRKQPCSARVIAEHMRSFAAAENLTITHDLSTCVSNWMRSHGSGDRRVPASAEMHNLFVISLIQLRVIEEPEAQRLSRYLGYRFEPLYTRSCARDPRIRDHLGYFGPHSLCRGITVFLCLHRR